MTTTGDSHADEAPTRVLVSLARYATVTFDDSGSALVHVTTTQRSDDWALRGVRRFARSATDTMSLLRRARDHDVLVLVTVGWEAFVAASARCLVAPEAALVVVDPILPRASLLARAWGRSLRRVERFAVIRSSDVRVLRQRFGVRSERVDVVEYPSPLPLLEATTDEGDYVYSAGWAQRDWPTLVAALAAVDWPATLAAGTHVDVADTLAGRVRVVPMPAPDEGRAIMASAGVVALAMRDSDEPSGPLVLLDALALGKAVVVSDVGGTRDYVEDGVTALVVPAGDPDAMAAALARLRSDPDLRRRLGDQARRWSRARPPRQFHDGVLASARRAARQRQGRSRRVEAAASATGSPVRRRRVGDEPGVGSGQHPQVAAETGALG